MEVERQPSAVVELVGNDVAAVAFDAVVCDMRPSCTGRGTVQPLFLVH